MSFEALALGMGRHEKSKRKETHAERFRLKALAVGEPGPGGGDGALAVADGGLGGELHITQVSCFFCEARGFNRSTCCGLRPDSG